MKKIIKKVVNQLPYVRGLYIQNERYKNNACFPPGHFYSTIVDVKEIKRNEDKIWEELSNDGLNDIELNTQNQIKLLEDISKYYSEIPFEEENKENIRYKFKNGMYSFTDGIVLYSMIRHVKPKRIIEIGSGHSSALMLDVNNLFFDNSIELTFIEPFPRRLHSLITDTDRKTAKVIERIVQDVDLSIFSTLEKGDILFIDSTHVSKCGSDLNFIMFKILPLLKEGVFIHFHDIFYPFEYPKEWVYKGYNWNENYILRAFLMNNDRYQIQLFSHYMHLHHKEAFSAMPLAYLNFGGNLWLKKE